MNELTNIKVKDAVHGDVNVRMTSTGNLLLEQRTDLLLLESHVVDALIDALRQYRADRRRLSGL